MGDITVEKIVKLENLQKIAKDQQARIAAMWPAHFRAAQNAAINEILKRGGK